MDDYKTIFQRNGPEEHVDIVTKLQNSARATQKVIYCV